MFGAPPIAENITKSGGIIRVIFSYLAKWDGKFCITNRPFRADLLRPRAFEHPKRPIAYRRINLWKVKQLRLKAICLNAMMALWYPPACPVGSRWFQTGSGAFMNEQMDLIPRQVEGALIHQRAADGYVNATAMCTASGKSFHDYSRQLATAEYLSELSRALGIPVANLVITVINGPIQTRGTWVHPDVAINLGQWCSPQFAVAVATWVREWLAGKANPQNLPYHMKRYMANRGAVPHTHFSMLNEMALVLIGPMEDAGYRLPDNMLPDISEGRMFCKWLRDEKGIDTDALPTYQHRFEDGRVVSPKLYPNEVLGDFRDHFHRVWLPQKAIAYFRERDVQALEYLPRLIGNK